MRPREWFVTGGIGCSIAGLIFTGLGEVELAAASFSAALACYGVSMSETLSNFLLPFTGEG